MGPFRAGATYAFVTAAFLALSFHLWGALTLECARTVDGVHCSRVTTGWLNNTETSRTEYGPIAKAYEGAPNQIVVATPSEERYVIDGFDITAVAQLAAFLQSTNPTLVVQSDSLAYFPIILLAIAAAVGVLSGWSIVDGTRRLRLALGESRAG